MAKDIIMPALGMAQETGLLVQWFKAEGEQVVEGEPLMEIETDKAVEEITAPSSGVLANVTAAPGDEIPVGQVIALILAPGEKAPDPGQAETAGADSAQSAQVQDTRIETTASADGALSKGALPVSPLAARIAAEHNVDLTLVEPSGNRIQKEDVLAYIDGQAGRKSGQANGPVLASPKARRLASEQGVDLTVVTGGGPHGAVLAADVERARQTLQIETVAGQPPPEPISAAKPVLLATSRKWQIMAKRLEEAWRTIPHFYLKREANATQLIAWRKSAQERAAEKITFTDLLVKLVAVALLKHPQVNASWDGEQILGNPDINVGLAVAVEDGLVVPVVHQADQLGLQDIARHRSRLVSAAQSGNTTLADLQGGTFTISNLGTHGVDEFSAIVNPPQAAILAVGRIADRVVPVDGQPAIQPMINLTLSCDHRVVDGARGALFLDTLAKLIENPLATLD